MNVDSDQLPADPATLFDLARQQFLASEGHDGRRTAQRFFIAVEALAQPLMSDGAPAGEPFRAVVADLSTGGLRLMHAQDVAAPLLAVRFGLWDESVSGVLRVLRRRHRDAYCESAGAFLTPLREERLARV